VAFVDQKGTTLQPQACVAEQFNKSNLVGMDNQTIYDTLENQAMKNGLICPMVKNMSALKPETLSLEVRTCSGVSCARNFDDFMMDKVFVTKMYSKKIDFEKMYATDFGSYHHMDVVTGRYHLNPYTKYLSTVALRFNLVEMFDSYFTMNLAHEATRKYFYDHCI
jgi:hypothetical protein